MDGMEMTRMQARWVRNLVDQLQAAVEPRTPRPGGASRGNDPWGTRPIPRIDVRRCSCGATLEAGAGERIKAARERAVPVGLRPRP